MSATMKETAARALPLVDLTNLNEDCSEADIEALCRRAVTPHGNVAAVCIWPRFVAQAADLLADETVTVATVVNFPSGEEARDAVLAATLGAIGEGADEIDLVLPYRALLAGDEERARAMVRAVAEACRGEALLKVIVEAGELGRESRVGDASRLAMDEGADFIKTSTGKVAVNATLSVARIMLNEIAQRRAREPDAREIGFKPAGGIRSTADAAAYLAAADDILGPDWVSRDTLRFGASGLLDDLLAVLDGDDDGGGAADETVY